MSLFILLSLDRKFFLFAMRELFRCIKTWINYMLRYQILKLNRCCCSLRLPFIGWSPLGDVAIHGPASSIHEVLSFRVGTASRSLLHVPRCSAPRWLEILVVSWRVFDQRLDEVQLLLDYKLPSWRVLLLEVQLYSLKNDESQ